MAVTATDKARENEKLARQATQKASQAEQDQAVLRLEAEERERHFHRIAYAADMNLAKHYLELNQIGEAL